MKIEISTVSAILVVGFCGCTPEAGLGGKAEIKGLAAHHAEAVPSTRVFIKYGATTSPGINTAVYDDSTVADVDGRFGFNELVKGAYYLYGIGFDSTAGVPVTAGIPVVISEKREVEEVLLPVTE